MFNLWAALIKNQLLRTIFRRMSPVIWITFSFVGGVCQTSVSSIVTLCSGRDTGSLSL